MTEENTSLAIDHSQDPLTASYTPDAPEPVAEEKPLSPREAIEKAAAELEKDGTKIGEPDEEPEKVEKPKAEAKPRAEDGKFAAKAKEEDTQDSSQAKADAAPAEEDGSEQDGDDSPSEGRDHDKPPARFLPRAKEKWGDVDPDVRSEVYRAIETMQKGLDESAEDRQFRKEIRQFEDMARDAGTTVRAALENYTNIDKLLRENPVAGIERILASVQITPQQYAQHVMGQAQQQQANPALAHTQRLEQHIQQLTQTVQQLTQGTEQQREAARLAEVGRTVIQPFIADHPRYHELEQDIAFFLNSGKVPSNLPERDRLEVAYDMAERINPAPTSGQERRTGAVQQSRPLNPAGAKSVRGAPAPGVKAGASGALTAKESINAAMDQIGF